MITVNFGDPPNPKQVIMFTDTHRYICYGGAKGGGKSWALRVKAVYLAANYGGIKILVLRRTYPELRINHILPTMAMLQGVAKYNEQHKSFTFPNGSRIDYGYCDSDRDAAHYQGQEYDILMIDEATTILEEWWDMIKLCVRGVNSFPKRTYLTCNPGGVGHEWVKRLFIDHNYKAGEDPDDYFFIPARVYDNKALMRTMPEYVKTLEALPPEKRAALLNGDWDSYEGKFFPEFSEKKHVVEPFDIPQHWRHYRALDYGLDMLACIWVAVSPDGDEYVYRELHEPNLPAAAAAAAIRKHSPADEDIYATYAPPDLWARSKESGITVAELFRTNGVEFTQADSNRINGWQQVKDHIKVLDDDDVYKPEVKRKTTPEDLIFANSPNYKAEREKQDAANTNAPKPHSKLRVFSTCAILIKHIKALQYDPDKIGDADTEPHKVTHICDALRYYCVSRTYAPKVETPLNALESQLRKRLTQSQARRTRIS